MTTNEIIDIIMQIVMAGIGIAAIISLHVYGITTIIETVKYYIAKYKRPPEEKMRKPETWNADYEAWRAEKLKSESGNTEK